MVGCKFPEVGPGTAYSRKCRCDRCRAHKKELRNKSAGRAWEERSNGMRKRYPVPAGPILNLLETWIAENRTELNDGFESLGQELGILPDSASRLVLRLRSGETTYMSLAQADKIISALYGPHYWYLNDDLQAIYEEHA